MRSESAKCRLATPAIVTFYELPEEIMNFFNGTTFEKVLGESAKKTTLAKKIGVVRCNSSSKSFTALFSRKMRRSD
jgi:hypothetical protein